jgi:phage gpG-like protein
MVERLKITMDQFQVVGERVSNLRPVLTRIGATMLSASQMAFQEQKYGGENWPARYESNWRGINVAGALSDLLRDRPIKARRFDQRPALVDTGNLRNSLTFAIKSDTAVEVGTVVKYAATHQFGMESVQPVTEVARKRLVKEYRRFKKMGGGKFKAIKTLGFLHSVDTLRTQIAARPFVGLYPDLKRDIVDLVEDYIARG